MVVFNYLPIVILAFLLEVFDASIGMWYGTTLTPALLRICFDPLQVVPAVLVSQLAGDFSAAFFHHQFVFSHYLFSAYLKKIRVDTGDLNLDEMFRGGVKVITNYKKESVMRVE